MVTAERTLEDSDRPIKQRRFTWLSWLWPQTIAKQILLVLTLVIIASQAINLIIILGERTLALRSNTYNIAIQETVRQISMTPTHESITRQPIHLPVSDGVPGSYFFSDFNAALLGPPDHPAERLTNVEAQLTEALVANDRFAIDIMVMQRLRAPETGRSNPPPRRLGAPQGPNGGGMQAIDPAITDAMSGPMATGMGPPAGARGGPREAGSAFGDGPIEEISFAVNLGPGVWFNAQISHRRSQLFSPRVLLATLILLCGTLLATGYFVTKISQPFAQFADAAERLGRGDTLVRIEENGSQDVRIAAEAFNKMQNRLTRMIETQRTMLRAVSHDLRTPLTAMRLNVEQIKDETKRDHLIKSIDDMTIITEELLGWAKDVSGSEPLAAVNLTSLLQSISEDYIDTGLPVSFRGQEPSVVKIRRVAMKRVFQNLIDNALKYGHSADILVEDFPKFVRVYIDDTGPGIPETELETVLNPFVRLDNSRNKDTGGTGLGLSISQAIIQGDGGKLWLSNRPSGGLRANVEIPKPGQHLSTA